MRNQADTGAPHYPSPPAADSAPGVNTWSGPVRIDMLGGPTPWSHIPPADPVVDVLTVYESLSGEHFPMAMLDHEMRVLIWKRVDKLMPPKIVIEGDDGE